mgnify:CR=1 FL=1
MFHLNIMLRCRLSYPKIMQIEGREVCLCDFFAQMQPILTKDLTKTKPCKHLFTVVKPPHG